MNIKLQFVSTCLCTPSSALHSSICLVGTPIHFRFTTCLALRFTFGELCGRPTQNIGVMIAGVLPRSCCRLCWWQLCGIPSGQIKPSSSDVTTRPSSAVWRTGTAMSHWPFWQCTSYFTSRLYTSSQGEHAADPFSQNHLSVFFAQMSQVPRAPTCSGATGTEAAVLSSAVRMALLHFLDSLPEPILANYQELFGCRPQPLHSGGVSFPGQDESLPQLHTTHAARHSSGGFLASSHSSM